MANIHASDHDNNGQNEKSHQNLHLLANQMASLTHQLVSFSEIEEEIDGKSILRPIISAERPSVCERKTALTQEYMVDLAERVEKMCQLIFNLKENTNRLDNLN